VLCRHLCSMSCSSLLSPRKATAASLPLSLLLSTMGTRVYVGGLPRDATSREIQDAFSRYGHISNVWIARNPPGFAFVVSAPSSSSRQATAAVA
jgi:hypothetical protein